MIKTKKNRKMLGQSNILTVPSQREQERHKEFWQRNKKVPSRYRYNLTICDEPKFIWYRNPKVGTRSLFHSFRGMGIQLAAEEPRGCYYRPDEYRDYFKFAFVRNPWERMVSGWLNKIVEANRLDLPEQQHQEFQHFGKFVSFCSKTDLQDFDLHFKPQHELIDLNELDYLGRMETFEKDVDEVFSHLGFEGFNVSHKNISKGKKNYTKFYNKRTRALVANIYRKDIQLFNYRFDS